MSGILWDTATRVTLDKQLFLLAHHCIHNISPVPDLVGPLMFTAHFEQDRTTMLKTFNNPERG